MPAPNEGMLGTSRLTIAVATLSGITAAGPALAAPGQGPLAAGLAGLALLAGLLTLLVAQRRRNDTLAAVLAALPDAVIQLDRAGHLAYANPAGASMLGLAPGAARPDPATPWQLVDRTSRAPLLASLLARAERDNAVRILPGTRLLNHQGLEIEVEGLCRVLPGHGHLLQLRDITETSEWRRRQPDLWDRDPVSALPGRRYMEHRLGQSLVHRRAVDLPLSFLTLPVSGISAVYAEHGSAAGDALVRHLATLIRAQVRDTDLVARMDDDSFAVLLAPCPAEVSRAIAARIRQGVDGFRFEWQGHEHRLRTTLGQVDMPPFDGSLDDLLAAARSQP